MPIALADPPRTAVNATIKRATLAAHRAVEKLDAESIRDLERIYRAAAADISQRIAANAGPDGNLALQELRSTLGQVEGRLRDLSGVRDALLNGTLTQAADLGVRPFAGVTLDTAASMRISNEALTFVRTFVAEDGLQLSDRIWRLDRGARDAVVNAIEQAVIQGHGASQAALEFLSRGEPVPIDVRNKVNAAGAAAIGKDTTRQLLTGTGNPKDNAMRLFRTEINRAHGEAYMKSGEDHPDFGGWRYLLSPAHPEPDICDLLSSQNLYGLGAGVYPSREKTPWPAHPNTLSFVEIVFKDEISDADRAGKETPIEALKRLTPKQQKGVLGAGKKAIFDQGKLTTGMIRTPLRAVQKRTGKAPPPLRPTPQPTPKPTPRRPVPPPRPRTLDEMSAAGAAKIDEMLARITQAGGDAATRLPDELVRDLATARPIDQAAKLASGGRGAQLVAEASKLFPNDWTQAADRLGQLTVKFTTGRGYYAGQPGGAGRITGGSFSTMVHEYTHRLQHALPHLDDFFQDLHHRRTQGDPLKGLGSLQPGHGYARSEVAREDRYTSPYQGKVYSGPRMVYLGKHGALEVITMTYQALLGKEPAKLRVMLAQDREMLNLAVGLLYHYVP